MLKFKRFKEKTKLSSKGSRVLGPCGDLVVAIYSDNLSSNLNEAQCLFRK